MNERLATLPIEPKDSAGGRRQEINAREEMIAGRYGVSVGLRV